MMRLKLGGCRRSIAQWRDAASRYAARHAVDHHGRYLLSRLLGLCVVAASFAVTLAVLDIGEAAPQAAQPAGAAARLPPDLLERLAIGKASMQDAAALLGVPRSTIGDVAIYSVGGYQITLTFSLDHKKTGFPPGVLLGTSIEVERPVRTRDLAPISLGGYWTAGTGAGSTAPLHAARLKNLDIKARCTPALRGGELVVRFTCAGAKAGNPVDVEIDASLSYGLDPDLVQRAERASLMMQIKVAEDDPNNPDRDSSQGLRQRYGISGPITGDAIWNLLQELPVAGYHLANKAAIAKQR